MNGRATAVRIRYYVGFTCLALFAGACGGREKASKPGTADTSPGQQVILGEEGRKVRPREWTTLRSWTGGPGRVTTDTFHIQTPEWRIVWEQHNPDSPDKGVLSIFAYDSDGRLQWIAVNHLGSGADTAYNDSGLGDFYLMIRAEDTEWSVAAEVPADSTGRPDG